MDIAPTMSLVWKSK